MLDVSRGTRLQNGYILALLMLLLALASCGSAAGTDTGGNGIVNAPAPAPDKGLYYPSIEGWQAREMEVQPFIPYRETGFVDADIAYDVWYQTVYYDTRYIPDAPGTDYWQTSAETLERGGGDCEDIAALVYRRLRELDFSDDRLGIVIVKWKPDEDHIAVYFVDYDGRAYALINGMHPLSDYQIVRTYTLFY